MPMLIRVKLKSCAFFNTYKVEKRIAGILRRNRSGNEYAIVLSVYQNNIRKLGF